MTIDIYRAYGGDKDTILEILTGWYIRHDPKKYLELIDESYKDHIKKDRRDYQGHLLKWDLGVYANVILVNPTKEVVKLTIDYLPSADRVAGEIYPFIERMAAIIDKDDVRVLSQKGYCQFLHLIPQHLRKYMNQDY
jgi:hypothetical protein